MNTQSFNVDILILSNTALKRFKID